MNNDVVSFLYNHLFINICANFMLVACYRYYLIHYKAQMNHHPKMLTLLCAIAILISMSYPVTIASGYIFDFRQVGFLVGSIIGGPAVSIVLGITIIAYRYFIGGHGAVTTLIIIMIMVVVVQAVRPFYWKQEVRSKLIIISGLSLLDSFMIHLVIMTFHQTAMDWTHCLVLAGLKLGTVLAVFYMIIQIKKYFQWMEEVTQYERVRIVSQIAASISHEVRNPLTVIRGFIQLMAERDMNQEKRSVYCKMIMEETDRAVGIINDYLALAKTHEIEQKQVVSVKAEVKYVCDVISPYALLQGVELELSLQSEGQVEIDIYKLRQALVNLMKNAIEAMPNGGKLTVATADVTDAATITIKDTGIGMTEEQIGKVGTPFYSTKSSGTGLGMMVVNHVIKSSGGQMFLSSQQGIGTEWKLQFPQVRHSFHK